MMQRLETSKGFWIILYVGYFLVGYFVISWLVAGRALDLLLLFPGEERIPFIPEAILGYLLVYVAIACFFWQASLATIRDHAMIFFLIVTFHFLCFLVIPFEMDRPIVMPDGTWAGNVTAWYFQLDPPRNIFPSLHVTFPLLSTLIMWNEHRRWGWALAGMTLLVAISVVLVKQHYVADVLAAGIVTPVLFILWQWKASAQ